MIPVLVVSMTLAGLLDPETVTCHLWKRLDVHGTKHCIYRGPNKTFYTHFPTNSFRECVKTFQCPYSRKAKKPSIHEILRGIQQGF